MWDGLLIIVYCPRRVWGAVAGAVVSMVNYKGKDQIEFGKFYAGSSYGGSPGITFEKILWANFEGGKWHSSSDTVTPLSSASTNNLA